MEAIENIVSEKNQNASVDFHFVGLGQFVGYFGMARMWEKGA